MVVRRASSCQGNAGRIAGNRPLRCVVRLIDRIFPAIRPLAASAERPGARRGPADAIVRVVLVNNTPLAAAEALLTDVEGRDVYVVVAKASFRWRPDGALESIVPPVPIADIDRFAGPPATTGLLIANECTLPKPRVDVLLQGELVLGAPAEQVDCTLEIGGRLAKTLRVFGERHWRHGATSSMVPSRARPFVRMPIDWRHSFGGADSSDPSCVDLRNPIGRGMRRRVASLEGHPVPNFEDPRAPITDARKRPVPVGWGPIAPHWQARSSLAGTYDARWQEERFPLLPADFDPAFLNAAPADQQLDRYQAGLEVRLSGFTPRRREHFILPEFAPTVTVVDRRTIVEVPSRVDTIVIELTEQRLSVVARAVHAPREMEALAAAFLGPLTDEQRRALRAGHSMPALRG